MLPALWNVAEPLEVEYRRPIHQSSDQSNSGRKEIDYSLLFLVQKATKGWRPVIDLSAFTGYVTLSTFKMEMVTSILGSIRREDVMFLIDPQVHLL